MNDGFTLSEEQKAKIQAISRDFFRFCKNNLYIKNKEGFLVKFKPNKPQRALAEYVISQINEGRPIKVIILKARQMGFSTVVEAIAYWWTSTNFNINTVIISNDEKSSSNLYMMFRRYYDNSNPLFKPSIRYNTKTQLSFEDFDETGKQIGLGSYIKTETAGNKSAGRSDTVNFLHASEVGIWENGEELVNSMLQTVPDMEHMKKPSMVFLESTAKGRGNFFHKEYLAAQEGASNFVPIFAPWWILDEYEREATYESLGELNEYESLLVRLMRSGCDILGTHFTIDEDAIPRKIEYYRRKSKDFAANPAGLLQEYPSTWQEAFVASGKNVFDALALQEMEHEADDVRSTEYFTVVPGEQFESAEIQNIPYKDNITADEFTDHAPLKIFEHPIAGHEYVVGADVAEGLSTGDYSVATIVDTQTMKTVARWRGHCDPDKFGEILGALGYLYNWALIGVEVNNHGLTTVQKLRDTFYTNLYKRESGYEEDFEEPTSHLGWKTDVRTKRLMINDLVRLVREKLITDKDIVFVNEAFSYIRDERGRTNAEEGSHDDVVMATAIAYQLFQWKDNDMRGLNSYTPDKISRVKRRNRAK